MGFKIAEIREILGEAYTDDIGKKLVGLHRSVVDPLLDDLDSAKRDATKYKTEADKVPGLQKDLDEAKKGEDWKAKYDAEKKAHDDYKAQIARDAEVAKVKAAYKKLLADEKIDFKSGEIEKLVLDGLDYSKLKLKEDGTLDGVEDLKKDIDTKWGGFKVQQRQRGERVDNPPPGSDNGGGDNSTRSMMAALHAARYGAAPEKQ